MSDEKPCALQVTIANEKELPFEEDIDPTIYEGKSMLNESCIAIVLSFQEDLNF